MAYNQGFYNLFLALVTVIGIVVSATGSEDVGAALMYAGCGSMVAAALVLATSDRSKLRPALIQGVAPALAVIALDLHVVAADRAARAAQPLEGGCYLCQGSCVAGQARHDGHRLPLPTAALPGDPHDAVAARLLAGGRGLALALG